MASMSRPQTVVIGCGTGRCGTKSLSKLIDDCQQALCTHERRPILPWAFSDVHLQARVHDLQRADSPVVGDVAYYYLPYLERLIEMIPDLKVVCLERDRQEVIDSYMQKTQGWNHWYEHDGKAWAYDPFWDATYPKYPIAYKPDAIGAYWDEYHDTIRHTADQHPVNVRVMGTETLNTRAGQDTLFDFIGISEDHRRYPDHCRHNVGDRTPRSKRAGNTHLWMQQLERATQTLADLLPPDASCILVDQDTIGYRILGSCRHIPFLERDGQYWGLPADGDTAIREFERLREHGAEFIIFTWPAFWWLEVYPTFHSHLQHTCRHQLTSEDLVVFDLRS
jgi:hypothetical protein